MGRSDLKNTQEVKRLIVNGYRRGTCDHNGDTIPDERRGMAGKGSHFLKCLVTTDAYRENYDRIFGQKGL